MPPNSHTSIIPVSLWSGIALCVLYLWQLFVLGVEEYILVAWAIIGQCCGNQHPVLDQGNVGLVVLFIANTAIFFTLIAEAFLFANDVLTVKLNLGIQVAKSPYPIYFFILHATDYVHYWDKSWERICTAAVWDLPFFLALWYAVFMKVREERSGAATSDEETPLLAEDQGAPPAERLPNPS